MMDPEDVIGRDAVLRLEAAGFRIVPRPSRRRFRTRYTCPVCGFSALGGQTGPDVALALDRAWHVPCVPGYPAGLHAKQMHLAMMERREAMP